MRLALVLLLAAGCANESHVGMNPLLHPPGDAVNQCAAQCQAIGLSLQSIALTWTDVTCQCHAQPAMAPPGGPAAPPPAAPPAPPPAP
ncbi:MAG TPA: hypothetical protein VLX92_29830 [Kofleriaceae bacterium]|nr:hypothetical protein [Kofleriaceae bacterium]